jgi:pimeloyl-ACP methyl ester carboxylesterase
LTWAQCIIGKGERGRPLVLIHGFCETGEIWRHFADTLSERFKVIVPDLPGFGKSLLPANSFTIDDIGATMLEWINQWQAERPVVIGHSLGGYVAMSMASQPISQFGGVGLFHSTAYPDSTEKKENRNKVIRFVERHGVELFLDSFVPGLFYKNGDPHIPQVRQIAAQTSPVTLVAYSRFMRDRPSYEEFLKGFSKPILFIAGEQDTLVPVAHTVAQTKLARFPVFNSLSDVAHMGMLEKEPATIEIVQKFMNFCRSFCSR